MKKEGGKYILGIRAWDERTAEQDRSAMWSASQVRMGNESSRQREDQMGRAQTDVPGSPTTSALSFCGEISQGEKQRPFSGEQGFPRGFLSGLGARVSGDDYLECCIQVNDLEWDWRGRSAVLAGYWLLL